MPTDLPIVKAAVVQAAPVLFNRDATVEKAVNLIKETARQGVRLILFPHIMRSAGVGFSFLCLPTSGPFRQRYRV